MILRLKRAAGQTIIELVLVAFSIASFMAMTGYLFTILEVAQNQTTLLRTQAFMELGNHSSFGGAGHGEDDPEDARSQVFFSLSQNNQLTRVNIESVEEFHEAVEGELDIRIFNGGYGRAVSNSDDQYWPNYRFPKAITRVSYFERGDEPRFNQTYTQRLAIVHNRSLDQVGSFNDTNPAIYSGSIHLQDYGRIAGLADGNERGLVDNVEVFKAAIRQLANNDDSLVREAESLVGSVNAADGQLGGLQSAAISMAIAAAMDFGLSGIAAAADGGSFFGGGLSSLGEGFEGIGSSVLGSGGNITDIAGSVFEGFTAPLANAYDGLKGLADNIGGLGEVASAGQAFQGLADFGSNISDIGQGVAFYGSLGGIAGLDVSFVQHVNTVSTIAGAPAAIGEGLKGLEGSLNDLGSASVDTWDGVVSTFDSIKGITQPITNVATIFAPEIAAPMSYVNVGLSLPSAIDGVAKGVSNLGNIDLAKPQGLMEIGEFTQNVGTITTGVGALSGNEDIMMAGGVVSMAGVAAQGVGQIGEFAGDLKEGGLDTWDVLEKGGKIVGMGGGIAATTGAMTGNEDMAKIGGIVGLAGMGASGVGALGNEMQENGIDAINPASMGKFIVEENVKGLKESASKFGSQMKETHAGLKQSLGDMFASKQKITDQGAVDFTNNMASISSKNSEGGISYNLDGIPTANGQVKGGHLDVAAGAFDPDARGADSVHGALAATNGQEVADAQVENIKTVKATVDHLQKFKRGEVELDHDLLAEGKAASAEIDSFLPSRGTVRDSKRVREERIRDQLADAGGDEKVDFFEPTQNLLNEAIRAKNLADGARRVLAQEQARFDRAMNLAMRVDSQGAVVSENPSATRQSLRAAGSFLMESSKNPRFNDYARYRMRQAAKKVYRLEIVSSREAFNAIRDAYYSQLD